MTSTISSDYDADLKLLPSGGYKALCITNLILCSFSVVLSIILIAATTVPLLYPKHRVKYSTYNLYLAYMAVPDLVANAFIVYLLLERNSWISDEFQSKHQSDESNVLWMFDHPFDHNVYILCLTGNLYVNAFLTFEIYRLLKNSNIRKRHNPPTIFKVTKQAILSYGLGIFIFMVEYLVTKTFKGSSSKWMLLYQVLTLIYVVIIPISVMVYVCVMIWKQELIRSTGSMYEGRLKILIIYFARIVSTEMLLWMPCSLVYLVSWSFDEISSTKVLAYNWSIVFSGSQAIVSFGFSLTKPDTRKLIFEIVKCKYCCNCYEGDGVGCCYERVAEGDNTRVKSFDYDDPYLRSSLPISTNSSMYRTSMFSKHCLGKDEKERIITDDGQQSHVKTNNVLDSSSDTRNDRNTSHC